MANDSEHDQNRSDDKPEPEEFTHYVHLADGRVIKHNVNDKKAQPLGSHYVEGEDRSGEDDGEDERVQTAIIGVYPR